MPTKKRKLDDTAKGRKKPQSKDTKKKLKKTKKPRVQLEYEIESEQTRQRLHN